MVSLTKTFKGEIMESMLYLLLGESFKRARASPSKKLGSFLNVGILNQLLNFIMFGKGETVSEWNDWTKDLHQAIDELGRLILVGSVL